MKDDSLNSKISRTTDCLRDDRKLMMTILLAIRILLWHAPPGKHCHTLKKRGEEDT